MLARGPNEAWFVAMLRFAPNATVHEHPGQNDAYVVCIDGEGWTSVGEQRTQLRANEYVVWPKGINHRLWTEESTMTTLMIEHADA